jgi:DNA-binding winged helix-turn-helix (wHTH) protein/tetratricopeptide (TPR) repeat protein
VCSEADNRGVNKSTGLIEAKVFVGAVARFFPLGCFSRSSPQPLLLTGFLLAPHGQGSAAISPRIRGSTLVAKKENLSDALSSQKTESLKTPEPQQANPPHADEQTGSGRLSGKLACSFAGLRLNADGTLWRDEALVHLPPKELAALQLLMAHAGQVVSPAQLKHELWGDVHVTADSVLKCMSSLRARLEPDACIQTIYKRGYRFSARIERAGAAPAGMLPRLAIMPFATRYSVPEHLGPAIAEEIIASLTGAPQPAVAVLARDSVFNLALRGLTAQQIGQQLKADLVLTGTLQAFCAHYRLRAEMIRVEDGVQIWVEDFQAAQGRTRGLEQELMHRLAYRLHSGIPSDTSLSMRRVSWLPIDRSSSPEQNRTGLDISASAVSETGDKHGSRQTEAYQLFLRGHQEWQTLRRHRMQDGMQSLLRAIELDPSLISAKVDLAHLCVTEAFYGFMPPAVSADFVHRAAESIPSFPYQAEAMLPALGWINFHFDRNLSAALRAFSSSAHLPHDPWITRSRAIFALSRHRFAEAITVLRAGIQEDPCSPWLQSRLAWAFHLDGQASDSVGMILNALSRFPEHEFTNLYGALILAYNGDMERAIQLAGNLAQRMPFFDLATAVHAYALARAGRQDEARAILEHLQWLSRERFLLSSFTPAVHVALGDMDAALAELRIAEEARCPWFFQMLADPRLKPLHGHPKFEQMQAILTGMEAEANRNLSLED